MAGKILGNRLGKWALALILLYSLAGCKSRAAQSPKSSADLLEVLRQLPDSLRQNPFGAKQPFDLDPAAVEQLISQGEVVTGEEMGWRLEFEDSSHHLLRFGQWGVDDGLHYTLLSLEGSRRAPWVLVLQSLDDHCCSYNRWGLYAMQNGKLVDQTFAGMPRLSWNDFFAPSQLGGSPPPPPLFNRHPFSMDVQAHPAEIRVRVVADYLELNYSEAEVGGMMAHLPAEPRVLRWEKGRFEWAQK